MDYTITKIGEFAGGLHVEYEFISPEDGLSVHMEMNFGKDMILRDAWKKHLDNHVTSMLADLQKKKEEKKVPGAQNPYEKFIGKHDLKD